MRDHPRPSSASVRPRLLVALIAVLGLCVVAPGAALAQSVAWNQRVVSGPTELVTAMAYDSARGVTVLFGGRNRNGGGEFSTWEWNGITWALRSISGPLGRYGHAMAYDATRGVTILFGGSTASGGRTSETWEWDGTTWTQWFVSGPSPRINHSMAFDAARGVTVLFGGQTDSGGVSDETWEWNGTTWTQRIASGPSPRHFHALAYDAARGVTVLFGGAPAGGIAGDTWEWNGTVWTERVVTGPLPGRYGHAMAYDTARGVTVLFGGFGNFYSAETWEWNGVVWTQRVVSGPERRTTHAMAYDSARDVAVVFGGDTQFGVNGETWELCVAPSVASQPSALAVCPAGTASLSLTASGSSPRTYRWQGEVNQSPGTWLDIADGLWPGIGTFSGSGTGTMTISGATLNAAGQYRCVVANACGSVTSDGALLTVCAADFDCDGTVDFFDYDAFVNCFEGMFCAPDKTADFDGDGTVDFFDYDAFVVAFEAGC